MTVITLNGKTFAASAADAAANPAHAGHYKARKREVDLFNRAGDRIGVINAHGCLCHAYMHPALGKWWYSFATITEIGEYASFLQSVDEPKAILRLLCPASFPKPLAA